MLVFAILVLLANTAIVVYEVINGRAGQAAFNGFVTGFLLHAVVTEIRKRG